ncbi:hypothetical protein B7463_g11048, partial [Scytalidium lignicola]
MPSQTATQIAAPVPRRHLPLLSSEQEFNHYMTNTLNSKATSQYGYARRVEENDYAPPAPPPSPVNFPTESWSTTSSVRR